MTKTAVRHTEGEIGKLKVVTDFLPPPEKLVRRKGTVRITLSLSRRSVEFFQREAAKQRVPYQRLIAAVVEVYAERMG